LYVKHGGERGGVDSVIAIQALVQEALDDPGRQPAQLLRFKVEKMRNGMKRKF
jgi:hypothetical protein